MDSITYYTDRIRRDVTGLHQEAEFVVRHHNEWPNADTAPDALRQLAAGAQEAADRLTKVAADALDAAEQLSEADEGDTWPSYPPVSPPVGLNAAQRRDWLRAADHTAEARQARAMALTPGYGK